ncbi:MAG: nicotinamide mononucleotide adenylyltransferase [Moritella sp.]|jgi:nicotinamide mononucleotide adenylyltransferase
MRAYHLPHCLFLLTVLLFLTAVTSCASFEKKSASREIQIIQHTTDANKMISQRVKDAATNVERNVVLSQAENYEYYAPSTWKKIKSDRAKMHILVNNFDPSDQGFFGGPSESTVLKSIRQTQASMDKAMQTKTLVNGFLAQPQADIKYLEPKINNTWKIDFERINDDLIRLIANLEYDDNIANHRASRDALQKKIDDLEILIVKGHYYSPLQAKFEKLDSQLIPSSYEQIQNELQQLDYRITQSPRDQENLTQAANLVKDNIQRAQHIVTDVNWINGLAKSQRENIVLHYRNGLEALSLKLLNKDLSTLSYKDQINEFEAAVVEKIRHNKMLKMEQLNEQGTEIEQLKSQLVKLHTSTTKTVNLTVSNKVE